MFSLCLQFKYDLVLGGVTHPPTSQSRIDIADRHCYPGTIPISHHDAIMLPISSSTPYILARIILLILSRIKIGHLHKFNNAWMPQPLSLMIMLFEDSNAYLISKDSKMDQPWMVDGLHHIHIHGPFQLTILDMSLI